MIEFIGFMFIIIICVVLLIFSSILFYAGSAFSDKPSLIGSVILFCLSFGGLYLLYNHSPYEIHKKSESTNEQSITDHSKTYQKNK